MTTLKAYSPSRAKFLTKERFKTYDSEDSGNRRRRFIGSEIVKQLSAHDEYEIRVLDALTKQIHGNNPEKSYLFQSIKDCCDFIRGDVRDFTTVQKSP